MNLKNIPHQHILEELPVPAAVLGPSHEIEWANRLYRDLFRLSKGGRTGKKCFTVWQRGEPCPGCPLVRVQETGQPRELEQPLAGPSCRPDAPGDWNLRLLPVKNSAGRVVNILELAYGGTPEKVVRQALNKSEARLRQAQKLAKIGHWELDLQTDDLFWSDEIFNIFEIDPQRFKASYEAFLEATHPDDREKVHTAYTESVENRTPYQIDHRLLLPDGRVKHVQERCETYYDDRGRQIRSLGTVQDITAQKQIEAENQKLQKQLIQAQRMESIGCLAGGVAHDYNNISSIILGYSELGLKSLDPGDPLHDYFTKIYDAAQRASDITRQLLAFARQQTIAPRLLDLNKILAMSLKMLGRLVGENIEISFLPGEGVWPIMADPSQIDQIMANLCVNARDSITDVGKVTIETGNVNVSKDYCSSHLGFIPGDYVMVSVSDNGHGIPPENMDKIFEPFFTTKEIGKGTGLGLATVYGIVKQNKGFINLYSEPGQGTVFRIYLARHTGEAEPEKLRKPHAIPPSRGETVLFVEDDPAILSLGNTILSQLGYAVLSASHPHDAIQAAKNHTGLIDLLITDVVMPGMNGRVLSGELEKMYPSIKTLFVSGYTANVIAEKGVLHHGLSFLSKPFSMEELGRKIRELLDGNPDRPG